ncbi:hypothetical protein ACT3S4_04275 [Psychrobacter sp. AOP30-A2-5]|uniref:hypothetical protein n=1 Tax=Psychrobacter sp. AOP30-A2-5 TaxID=3457697 RepID=UPI0040353822
MSDVKCPYCDAVQDTDDWLEYGGHDGDDFEHECDECEEVFEAVTRIDVAYRVLDKRGEENSCGRY